LHGSGRRLVEMGVRGATLGIGLVAGFGEFGEFGVESKRRSADFGA
jgi:hypothetical protein